MKENNKFNFVLHRENFLTSEQCDELIQKHGRNNLEETFLKLARIKDEF